MRLRRPSPAVVLAVFLAAGWALPWQGTADAGEALRITGSSGLQRILLPGETFELVWMHSVELTEWRETYTIVPGGGISLTASEFSSFGAGLPDRLREADVFQARGGTMRIAGPHPPLEVLRVRLSKVSPHVLRAGERRIDLFELFGEDAISIRVEKQPEDGKGGKR